MNITIIGTGYVGLVAGTCFAEIGNQVICVDIDQAKVERMQQGQVPIYEPELEDLFQRNIREGRLTFTTDLAAGVAKTETIFLALPTPSGEDGSADLSYILNVADKLGPLLQDYAVIVDKSTVPVGTAKKVAERIAKGATVPFDVVSNPEFLKEGFAVSDFMHPDRIVVGSSSERANEVMRQLYAPLITDNSPIFFMDEASAEMTKYAANSFLATKISFMNEIANICEKVGANVDQVRQGIGTDARIGKQFLYAGLGYGGSCFPKDVKALNKIAAEQGYDFGILQAVHAVNVAQRQRFIDKIMANYHGDVAGKTFALWGLAFKANTDDIREAPAIDVARVLSNAGASVVAFDPEATANVKRFHSDIANLRFADNAYAALEQADALLIATDWPEFYSPDFSRIKELLKAPVIFDGRNLYKAETMAEHGFYYQSIGRATIETKA